jgi:hypothetical protein
MSKIVLCAIDFSEASRHALQVAATLAGYQHAHLTVLFAYRLNRVRNGEAVEQKKQTERDAAQHFAVLENEVLKGMEVAYDFKTEVGFVADRIKANAREAPVDFIVMDKTLSMENKDTFEAFIKDMDVPLVIVP